MSSNINYAKAVGYHSEAAAFIFAILYLPFAGWFIRQSFVRPTYVHFTLVLFTTIRLAAFILRGILVSVESIGENLSALIADEILFGVGFFSLLYASYTLVLDLETMQNRPESSNPIIRLTKNRRAFRLTLTLAVALGIAASSSVSNTGVVSSTGKTLREVSTIIFLILTVLQLFQAFLLAQMEIATRGQEKRHNESFGARHAMSILLIGAALLLVREAFSTATMTNIAKQNNEHFWYPLVAVPEILIVALMSTPGLVLDCPRAGPGQGQRIFADPDPDPEGRVSIFLALTLALLGPGPGGRVRVSPGPAPGQLLKQTDVSANAEKPSTALTQLMGQSLTIMNHRAPPLSPGMWVHSHRYTTEEGRGMQCKKTGKTREREILKLPLMHLQHMTAYDDSKDG